MRVTTQVILREKAIRVPFCHHACCSSIRGADAAQGKQGEDLRDADISELMEMLAEVPEFRGAQGREYTLSFILAVCVVATLAGAKNYREIATVAAGIPQSQLRLLGRARDKVVFAVERVFRHFLASVLPVREPLLISLVIPGFSY